mgnify:CR=1 FL=1
MTILVVLIGLLISHYATGVRHFREFDFFLAPARWIHQRRPEPSWLLMIGLILTCFIAAAIAEWLLMGAAGLLGWFVLALVVFIYCLGPRDLDKDVHRLVENGLDGNDLAMVEARRAMRLTPDADPQSAAAAVLHAALSRWFGLLFWFVILGVPGALLYRLVRAALQEPFDVPSIAWLARLRLILDLPVLALMVLSAGLCSDFDRVFTSWRKARIDQPLWGFTPMLLDQIAATALLPEATSIESLSTAHRLVWRMLVLWLVVMSLLLIAGWMV